MGAWFRGEMKEFLHDTLLSSRAAQRGYFDERGVRGIVEQHIQGEADHTYPLWTLLMLELWFQTWIDCEVVPAEAS